MKPRADEQTDQIMVPPGDDFLNKISSQHVEQETPEQTHVNHSHSSRTSLHSIYFSHHCHIVSCNN